ncbi:hypothetical protein BCT30_14045 [Enterovibrio norvegicus]|uniref:Uncharacterized protein n=1 Tax=Enterovibrio norvegicus DSM 15893 TaxID=1121869 RepID=A0A1I5JDS3_9GAMM|nr:hypothetical protein [Enterovibrio norvegicus]MCC4800635.1 hypothetical protein [Enterovibrio norvegicus]PMH67230.1 hypothetical protein BCU62_07605 [Enterovibrio norvegicus]PMI31784.1 hypothetical protein BCU47_14500 [Enterovibrio norvegicus]PMI38579.1 hypothetical protein BCU46_00950 [Enterovibrio norvegicus]PMN51846.1 hypothetical protein BCT30_14045 [Enterovibrio norvegicus]
MAKAQDLLKKHFSLVSDLQKVNRPLGEKNPIGRTKANAEAQRSRLERRIAELEKQREVFNRSIDESIKREQEQLDEIRKFEDMVTEPQQNKEQEKPKPVPKPAPKPRAKASVKAATKKVTPARKTTTRAAAKKRTPPKA